jgi:hypothetical protein
MVSTPGDVSLVQTLPQPLSQIGTQVQSLAVIATGYGTPEARLEIFRGDTKDAPYIWNKDQYTIIQTLSEHPQYQQILRSAGLPETPILDEYLAAHVLVVKRSPNDFEGHWCKALPSFVADLLRRESAPGNE